jgi:Tol biopolymer transport system component
MSHRRAGVAVAVLVLFAALAAPAAATPPGSNGLIVWQQDSPRSVHLRVANPDGSGVRKVFANRPQRGEFEGTFSPADPNLTFFSRFAMAPFSEDIFIGNLATGEETRIRRPGSADIAPTLSPDGTRIAYFAVARPKNFDPEAEGPPPPERIHVMGVDGSGDRAITPPRRRSIDPDWSPDGTRIVYTEARFRNETPQQRLAVMNADGSGRRILTQYGGANEVNPKWTPDGQTIVFEQWRERGKRSDIASISPDGGPVRKILATKAWETNPIPSPDGTRILFTSDRDRRGPERLGPGFELYTMSVDGTDIERVTNNRRPDFWPDWQRLP